MLRVGVERVQAFPRAALRCQIEQKLETVGQLAAESQCDSTVAMALEEGREGSSSSKYFIISSEKFTRGATGRNL